MNGGLQAVILFRGWLKHNGYDYLEDGLTHLPPGKAIREIAKRVGVKDLKGTDLVEETLPRVMKAIRQRCQRMK